MNKNWYRSSRVASNKAFFNNPSYNKKSKYELYLSEVPVPKIRPSGWNWAHVKPSRDNDWSNILSKRMKYCLSQNDSKDTGIFFSNKRLHTRYLYWNNLRDHDCSSSTVDKIMGQNIAQIIVYFRKQRDSYKINFRQERWM